MENNAPAGKSFFATTRSSWRIIRWIINAIVIILALVIIFVIVAALTFPRSEKIGLQITSDDSSLASLDAGSPGFIQQFAKLTDSTVENGEPVIPIDDGQNFLPLLLTAVENASSSIDFTTYPWGNGTFSDQVFAALINAAKRGVQVRVLLDAQGGHEIPASTIETLEQAGGKVAKYHPFSILNPLQYDERDHMRVFVVDGTTGFFGGMGIDDHWLGIAGEPAWQDMMFEVKDTMAESLQNTFAGMWQETSGETLSGPTSYSSTAYSSSTSNEVTDPTTNTFVSVVGTPSESLNPIQNSFDLTALSAQKRLFVVNPYFIPDQEFLTILEEKARAGVDVRLILPGNDVAQVILLRLAWHRYYEDLLQAGVKIYEYQPAMIHTKMIIADDTWSLLGSANIDNRSEEINAENVMGINDPMLAASLEQTFAGYQNQSKQITLADWQKEYGFFQKIVSDSLLVFKKQL